MIELRITGATASEIWDQISGLTAKPGAFTPPAREGKSEKPTPVAEVDDAPAAKAEDAPAGTTSPEFRLVGSAGDDRRRRTKAEIAEDEGLTDLAEANGVPLDKLNEVIAEHGRAAARLALATSDEPADADPQDDVDEAEPTDADLQDDADEAEEEPEEVTVDTLRDAMQAYVAQFGMPAAQTDGRAIFEAALGKPPADNPFWTLSLVSAAGPDALARAIAPWKAAVEAGERHAAA